MATLTVLYLVIAVDKVVHVRVLLTVVHENAMKVLLLVATA